MTSIDHCDDDFQLVNENDFEHPTTTNQTGKDNNNDYADNDDYNVEVDNGTTTISQLNQLQQEINKKTQDFQTQMKNNKKEFELISNLKKELQSKINENNNIVEKNQQICKTIQDRISEYNQLTIAMKKEIESTNAAHSSLEEEQTKLKVEREKFQNERKEFEKNLTELKTIVSKLSKTSQIATRNEEIYLQLNAVLNQQNAMEKEITHIQQLKKQQQESIQKAKADLQDLQSNENKETTKLDINQAYCCKDCGTHIALESDIESRSYQVGQGTFNENKRGYLFKNGYNMVLGNTKVENFASGTYTISWVSCTTCKQQLGWKYVSAENAQNDTKTGKYCLARYLLIPPQDSKNKENSQKQI